MLIQINVRLSQRFRHSSTDQALNQLSYQRFLNTLTIPRWKLGNISKFMHADGAWKIFYLQCGEKYTRSIFFLVIHQTFLVTDRNISRSEKNAFISVYPLKFNFPLGKTIYYTFSIWTVIIFFVGGEGGSRKGEEEQLFNCHKQHLFVCY